MNIDKQLTLRGIDNPVIDASGNDSVIILNADEIVIEGFIVTGSGHSNAGIMVTSNNNKQKPITRTKYWGVLP